MGEDLIVTLNVLPLCTSPVIVPEVVYFYRVGGGTSRYMPNMLNEFLALYEYKYEFALLYPMPYDVKKLMDIEIINIVRDYLCSFVIKGKSDKTKLHKEIQRIFDNLIINGAAKNIANNEVNGKVCNYICLRQSDEFADYILKLVRKNKWKSTLKKLLLSV